MPDMLPLEMWAFIFSYLNATEYCVARLVCRYWYHVLTKVPIPVIYHRPAYSFAELEQAIKQYTPQDIHLGFNLPNTFNWQLLSNRPRVSFVYMTTWPLYLKNLRVLSIYSPRVDNIDLSVLHNIHSLELKFVDSIVYGQCPSVKELTAVAIDALPLTLFPSLINLNLKNVNIINYDASVIQRLQKLHVTFCELPDLHMFATAEHVSDICISVHREHYNVTLPQTCRAVHIRLSNVALPANLQLPRATHVYFNECQGSVNVNIMPLVQSLTLHSNVHLSRFDQLVHVTNLDLFDMNIKKLPAIPWHNLIDVTLSFIDRMSSVACLEKVEILHLSFTSVETVTGLLHLKELHLDSNLQLQHVGHLPRLELLEVIQPKPVFIDWSTLLNVQYLTLQKISILFICPPLLKTLSLYGNDVLISLPILPPTVTKVSVSKCCLLEDISSAMHVPDIVISYCEKLSNTQAIFNSAKSVCLTATVMDIVHMNTIILNNAQRLSFFSVPITQIPIAPMLVMLEVSNSQVHDLMPLMYADNLRTLYMDNTSVADLSPLQHLTHLRYVSASECPNIVDVTFISHVWHICLCDCDNIVDVSSLFNAIHVDVTNCFSITTGLELLQERVPEFLYHMVL
jgi:hypothetical protein